MTPENREYPVNITRKRPRRSHAILGAAIGLGALVSGSACSCENAMDREILNGLSAVCQGQGVARAADFDPESDTSPIVILNLEGKKHSWTNKVPEEWRPLTVEHTELVACIGKNEEKLVQDCDYNIGPNVKRYEFHVDLYLREAKTAREVSSVNLSGSTPDKCKQSERVEKTRISGSKVSFGQARDWLERYVR